jgi:hypothetical protein
MMVLPLHILAGVVPLLAGYVALFATKGASDPRMIRAGGVRGASAAGVLLKALFV